MFKITPILLLPIAGAVIFLSLPFILSADTNNAGHYITAGNWTKGTSAPDIATIHIDTLQYAGDEAINMAIASEGYTEDEMEEFRQEGEKLVKGLFSISPFDRFKGYFNLFLIRIPSAQSGISTPNHETDTPFKVRASGNGLDRLLIPDDIEACKRIADSLLGEKCDILCLAANFPDYGGAGGEITVVSGHYMATEILAHELGHSVGGLGDEYYSCEEFIGRFPNMSLNAHTEASPPIYHARQTVPAGIAGWQCSEKSSALSVRKQSAMPLKSCPRSAVFNVNRAATGKTQPVEQGKHGRVVGMGVHP